MSAAKNPTSLARRFRVRQLTGFPAPRKAWPHLRPLFKASIPLAILHGTFAAMQITDAWMVGKSGTGSLAAIGSASVLLAVISIFGFGLLTSVNTQVSIALGAERQDLPRVILRNGLFLALAFGLATLAAWPTAPVVLSYFDLGSDAQRQAVQYFQICLIAIPFQAVATTALHYQTAQRDTLPILIAFTTGTVANACISAVLVFGWFGFPKLGIAGAAIGTLSSSILLFFLCAKLLHKPIAAIPREHLPGSSPNGSTVGELLKVGIPIGVQNVIETAVLGLVVFWLVSKWGEADVAAATAVTRCAQIVYLPCEGLANSLLAEVGHLFGARKFRQARYITSASFLFLAAYMSILGIIAIIFRVPLMGIFSSDPDVIKIGARVMILIAFYQFFDAMNITFGSALRGVGDTLWPLLAHLYFAVVIDVVMGLVAVHYFKDSGSISIWVLDTLYACLIGASLCYRWKATDLSRLYLARKPTRPHAS